VPPSRDAVLADAAAWIPLIDRYIAAKSHLNKKSGDERVGGSNDPLEAETVLPDSTLG
jgi:hypothetical protein